MYCTEISAGIFALAFFGSGQDYLPPHMEADSTVTLFNIYDWLHKHRKQVIAGASVAAVVALLVATVVWRRNATQAEANQELFAVPSLILPIAQGDSPSAKTLLDIGGKFSGTSAGNAAELLAAKQLFLDGKYPEAQQAFSKFVADHAGSPLLAQAKVGVAACLEAQGKTGDAVSQYKEINAIYGGVRSIAEPVLLTLGRLSETGSTADQMRQAVNYYTTLVNVNDRTDPWVVEAGERLQLLWSKHPELRPQPPATAPTSSPMLTPSSSEMEMSAPPGAGAATPPAGTTQPPGTTPPATNAAPGGRR